MALRRLFLAVSLTDRARSRIAERLEAVTVPGRAVRPENWHLTLRFIGGVEESMLDRITAALDQAHLGEPIRIEWGALGAFPRPTRAGVLWVGLVAGADDLQDLHARTEDALVGAGVEPDDRPFRPHLTISRIRPQEDVSVVVASCPPIGGEMQVRSVDLYESHLGPGQARYKRLEVFPLR